jgi:hypothetical protein
VVTCLPHIEIGGDVLRIFLGINVLVWLPYGIFCFFQPGYLNEATGLAIGSTTASTEVRAMYGGLQASIGCFALAALVRPDLARSVLLTIAFLSAGLATGRLGGMLADGGISGYTIGAAGFEILLVCSSVYLLSRAPAGDSVGATT